MIMARCRDGDVLDCSMVSTKGVSNYELRSAVLANFLRFTSATLQVVSRNFS